MEDSAGSQLTPQRRRGADGPPSEPDGVGATAEQGAEPAADGSDPDDDSGWLPV
ncbi:hypothetical protein [Jiangella rhizosphaerae]|uniref:hypothetical protein n=1 Tax=Jiangella rhizosphaerae TaxID=2293569 RepID=UPI001313E064|nr:hypothetical protein [Jiangella rhizosphaerae]